MTGGGQMDRWTDDLKTFTCKTSEKKKKKNKKKS